MNGRRADRLLVGRCRRPGWIPARGRGGKPQQMTGEPRQQAPPVVADAAPRFVLVVHAGAKAGLRIPCRRVVTLIGSRPGCKVNLRHADIAPVHTAIVNTGAQILAIDLASKRGTKLNGLKLEHEALSHGDLLEIGPSEFRVEVKQPAGPGSDDALPVDLDQTPEAVALEHLETGRVLRPNRDVCVIGRRTGCDIHIEDPRVSRAHVLLLQYFGFPAVCDLLSATGMFINDERSAYRMVKDEDVMRIGQTQFRIRLVGSKVGRKQPAQKQPSMDTNLIQLEPDETDVPEIDAGDLIDIQSVEGAQRWRVADQLEKVTRKA